MPQPSLDEIFGSGGQSGGQPRQSLDDIFGAPQKDTKVGDDKGAFASGVQGFNSIVPFGNRITAGGAALALAPFTDMTVSELYDAGRANQKATEQAHPTANLVGTGAGIAATLPIGLSRQIATTPGLGNAANALNKASTATANFIRGGQTAKDAGVLARAGSLGLRSAKSAAVAAPTAALYQYGASNKEGIANPERLSETMDAAKLGAGLGAALPVAGAVIGGVADEVKSLIPAKPETSQKLRAAANPFFDKFTKSGATYSAKLTDEIADLADSVRAKGIAGSTKKADDALNEALDFYSGLRGKTLSPSDIQKLDQSFADDIARFNKAGEYNFGRILNNLKYEFRSRAFDPQKATNYVTGGSPNAVQDLVKGNKLWAQSYKAKDIETILAKARGTENPQTSIRTSLKNLLANDKKMAMYNASEKAVLENALKRGYTGGLLKLFGGRLTDSVAGGIAGMSAGGPVGAIAGSLAGKAVGGGFANVAGGIQGNRLRGALQKIQSGATGNNAGRAISPLLSAPTGAATGLIPQTQTPSMPQIAPRMQQQLAPRSANTNFDSAVDMVMDIEGGYVADDAGKGATNLGINKTANPDVNIAALDKPEARKLYKQRYWNAINGDNLPPELALVGFDAAVNHGPARARAMLKASGGDPQKLLQIREREYARLIKANPKKFSQYADGWMSRLKKLQSAIA